MEIQNYKVGVAGAAGTGVTEGTGETDDSGDGAGETEGSVFGTGEIVGSEETDGSPSTSLPSTSLMAGEAGGTEETGETTGEIDGATATRLPTFSATLAISPALTNKSHVLEKLPALKDN